MEIISKVLSTRIKGVLPYLISYNQMAYFKNRFKSESGRLKSDILKIPKNTCTRRFVTHSRYRKSI